MRMLHRRMNTGYKRHRSEATTFAGTDCGAAAKRTMRTPGGGRGLTFIDLHLSIYLLSSIPIYVYCTTCGEIAQLEGCGDRCS